MISFFAKPAFLRVDKTTGPHIVRVSSRVRGQEIAEYLGAKFSPQEREPGDLCIFVKPRSLEGLKNGDYVDILDGIEIIPKLKERPNIKVISMSQIEYEYLIKELKNEIHLIHHHHINFEEFRRTRNENLVGGLIGHSEVAYNYYAEFKERLSKVGIDFIADFNSQTREDMIKFFKKIDFMLVWNIPGYKDCFYSHPTKLINAAAFGIPTLTQPMAGYKEFDGFYIPITDSDSVVKEAEKLKDINYYNQWSDKIFEEAKKYHISEIAKLYRALK
jgi:hypothetical protein